MTLRPHLLAAGLILTVLGACWSRSPVLPLGAYDQPFYLGIADDLLRHGRFTDGVRFEGAVPRPPGMRFTPLYPALLAALAAVDPGLRRGMDCVAAQGGLGGSCPRGAGCVRSLQFLMLAAALWLLWWSGWRCTGRRRTGWIALALALVTAPLLLRSAGCLMTETLGLVLVAAASALALRAAGAPGGGVGWLFGSGLALGLAMLSRPGFAWLAGGIVGAGLPLAAARGAGAGSWRRLGGFALGAALPPLPWIVRNALLFGRPSLTFGYASHTFVQRLSFDAMGWREYRMSFVCWLPDGSGLGALLAGRHACDRFGWDRPDSFYAIGIGPMLARTLREAGGWPNHMAFLLHGSLLRDPLRQLGWHAMVTLPLALRGLCLDHYWGLVLAPVCLVLTVRSLRRRDAADRRFLVLALPAWFMLVFNAAVAVNQVRYNLMLVLPFSVAGAMVVEKARALPWTRSRRSLENPITGFQRRAFGGSGQSPAFIRSEPDTATAPAGPPSSC